MSEYYTIDEIRRKKKDDEENDSEYYTIDEIRKGVTSTEDDSSIHSAYRNSSTIQSPQQTGTQQSDTAQSTQGNQAQTGNQQKNTADPNSLMGLMHSAVTSPKFINAYKTKVEASNLLSSAADKMQYSTSEIESELQSGKEAAAKSGKSTDAYDEALKMLQEYSGSAQYQTPEELQKVIDSTPFDYTNKETVKKALGAGENQDELADYYSKYRSGIISNSDGRDDEKYKRLDEIISPRIINTSNQLSAGNATKIAYTSADGKSINYGDLLVTKVAENRKSDLTASKDQAGKTLDYLGSGSRKLTDGYKATAEDMQNAGWDSQYSYYSYSIDGDFEKKSAVFSPVVLDEKGEVKKILTPDEMEEYAKTALTNNSDPLKLQATETYNGFYGSSLATENAKRINRLSERYFNDTDLDGLVAMTGVNNTAEDREKATEQAKKYGIDVEEIQHYSHVKDVKEMKDTASSAYAEWSKQNIGTGAAATAANIVASPAKAAEFIVNLGEGLYNNSKANDNAGALSSYRLPPTHDDFVTSMSSESTQSITEAIRSEIKGSGNSPFLNFLGDAAATVYGGVSSGAQSAATALTCVALFGPAAGEAVSLAVMSGEAANDAYNEVIDNGGTVSQATMYGIASGVNEALFEKVSLDHLISIKDTVGKDAMKTVIKNTLKQGGIEASEEAFTEIANRIADDVINTDKSQYNRNVQNYIDQGYSEDEAKGKADLDFAGQIVESAAGGFIGGLVGGGGKIVSNTVQNVKDNAATRETGAKITSAQNVPALIDTAKSISGDTDSELSQQAAKVEQLYQNDNSEGKPSRKLSKEVGTLQQMVQERNIENIRVSSESVVPTVRQMVSAATGTENSDAVNAIVKTEFLRGDTLTDSEQAALNTPVVQKLVQENQGTFAEMRTNIMDAYQKHAETASLAYSNDQEDYDSFDTTDDGKTYIKGTDNAVEFEKVVSMGRNDMEIATTGGETVKGSELDYGDPNTAVILRGALDIQNRYDNSTVMQPEFVNTALSVWKDSKLQDNDLVPFMQDVEGIYNAANTNDTYTPSVISTERANILTNAAIESKNANITAKSAQLQSMKIGTRHEGAVFFEGSNGTNISIESSKDLARQGIKLNEIQKIGIDTVVNMAKSTGVKFRFFQSTRNSDGMYVSKYSEDGKASPNGFYKNGEIYVDINAGNSGEGLVLFTVSHELAHFMRDFAPEEFDSYAKFLFDNYAKRGLSVRQAVHSEMHKHQNLRYDEAYEEVVARLSESFLRDVHLTEKSRELYNTDKTVWEKIRDGLQSIVERINKWMAGLSPESDLGKIGMKMAKENREILDRFVAGIKAASENAAYIENTTDEGGVRMQSRIGTTDDGRGIYRTNYEKNTPKVEKRQDIINLVQNVWSKKPISLTIVENGKERSITARFNPELSERSDLSKIAFGNRKGNASEKRITLDLSSDLYQIAEESHFVKSKDETGKADNPAHDGVKKWHYFVTNLVFEEADGTRVDCYMNIDVKENSDGDWFYSFAIEKGTAPQTLLAAVTDESATVPTNSIPDSSAKGNTFDKNNLGMKQSRDADYLSAVNRGDMETAQRMVDEAAERAFADSKVRSREGKLKKVYHGTGKDFSVFDNGRFGTNYDGWGEFGRGFYATDNKKTAKKYAERSKGDLYKIMEGYIDIKKPLYVYEALPDEIDLNSLAEKHNIPYWVVDGMKRNAGRMIDVLIDNGEDVQSFLKQFGYDGIIEMSGKGDMHQIVFFYSDQFKSADPVTYDDGGNVIPLSERFNSEKKDIRYDSRDDWSDLIWDDISEDSTDTDLIRHHLVTNNDAIGEILNRTRDVKLGQADLRRNIKAVLSEYGFKGKAAQNISQAVENVMSVIEAGIDMTGEDILHDIGDAVYNELVDDTYYEEGIKERYDELIGLLSEYKDNGTKFYLTDRQLANLKEIGMTFPQFRAWALRKENGMLQIVRDKTLRGATKLNLEDLEQFRDVFNLDNDTDWNWDSMTDEAPRYLYEGIEGLKDAMTITADENFRGETDQVANRITAALVADVVEKKYGKNFGDQSNKYIKDLTAKLRKERDAAVQKQKERDQKRIDEFKRRERERTERLVQEEKDKRKEQRSREHDRRKRTELRGKVRKLADSFRNRLTKPKKGQYVPRELISQTIDILRSIDLDSHRSENLTQRIKALYGTYEGLKTDNEAYAVYDPVMSMILKNLSENVGNTPIMDMSLSQLGNVYQSLRSLDEVIRNAVKMVDTEFKQSAHELGREWIAEINQVKAHKRNIFSDYTQSMLRADVMFNRIAGWKKNSISSQLCNMLDDGQLKMTQLEMEFSEGFDELMTDFKQLRSLSDTKNMVDIGLKDQDGNTVMITRGMMLSLYMHTLNEDNARHLLGGGLTIPEMKAYYKGDMSNAYGSGQTSVRPEVNYNKYIQGIKSRIEKVMTPYEMEWINAAQEFFDVKSKTAINDTTMKLYHFKKATVNNYFPIHTDPDYRQAAFEDIQRDMSLENSGFMKERIHASNPILLEDITDVINNQIQKVAKYCGMTIAIKNFEKVYGTTTLGFDTSVQKALKTKYSGSATAYIDNLMTDLTDGRKVSDKLTKINNGVGKARGNLAQATLTLNPSVSIAQAASYPTAAAVIGWKPLIKAMKMGVKSADRVAIADVSPLLWKRLQGYSSVEIGDLKNKRMSKHKTMNKLKKAMGWIEFFDGATVGRLYYACEFYVDDQYKNLKKGSEEYKEKVAEVYNNVIEKTQPNYTVMQRPDILRNPNEIVKSLTMFMTQRLQNFNIVYDAIGEYNRMSKDLKAGVNDVTVDDKRQARLKVWRAASSQVVAAVTIVAMKTLASAMLYNLIRFRDDDDELTAERFGWSLLDNFADTIFGCVVLGSDVYSLFKNKVFKTPYYGLSMSGIDSFKDVIKKFTDIQFDDLSLDDVHQLALSACQLFGIPAKNAEKIGTALYYYGKDIVEGTVGNYEQGVKRTTKQNMHRIEVSYLNGDTAKATVIRDEMLNEKIESEIAKGQSKEDAEKKAKSSLRNTYTDTYKQRYIDAVKGYDYTTANNIRNILKFSGLYPDLDKDLKKWVK